MPPSRPASGLHSAFPFKRTDITCSKLSVREHRTTANGVGRPVRFSPTHTHPIECNIPRSSNPAKPEAIVTRTRRQKEVRTSGRERKEEGRVDGDLLRKKDTHYTARRPHSDNTPENGKISIKNTRTCRHPFFSCASMAPPRPPSTPRCRAALARAWLHKHQWTQSQSVPSREPCRTEW